MIQDSYALQNDHNKFKLMSIITHSYKIFFLVIRTFKVYCFSNFQICNTVFLTPVTMLYIISPLLIYFMTGMLCLWTPFSHFTHFQPPLLATTNLLSVSMSLVSYLVYCLPGPSMFQQLARLNSFFLLNFISISNLYL